MAETENPPPETTMEERGELMLSPLGGQPTLRKAHFLKPSFASIKDPPPYPLSSNPTKEPPLKVKFSGSRYRQEKWTAWVHQLLPRYRHIWEKAGILEAILSSTYQIMRRKKTVIALAERWDPETNTFVFPWGESTLTLEDMRVLGGYSVLGYPVLGYPVLSPDENRVIKEIEEGLCLAQREIKKRGGYQTSWMRHFMGSDHSFEHEAFLALWLARFVLPSGYEVDSTNIFPLAIHLSRGTPIALAPAVLASIYRNLSLLKKFIMSSLSLTDSEIEQGKRFKVQLWAPFQLVLMWVWERFPPLRPNPNLIRVGEPRSARWHGLKNVRFDSVSATRSVLDSAGEYFQWRPYAVVLNNWSFKKFYRENEEWVMVRPEMDKELVSFVLCIRVGELVGLNCIEQYLPHRVAMQFGYDQDLPGEVPRFNNTFVDAWSNYCRPITDEQIYLPARLFESDVTAAYFSWRTSSMIPRNPHSTTKKIVSRPCWGSNNQDLIHPGSPVDEEDSLTIAELFRGKKRKSDGIGLTGDDEPHSVSSSPSSSDLQIECLKKTNNLVQKGEESGSNIPENVNGLNCPSAETKKNGEVIRKCMKDPIQTDRTQSISEKLGTPENVNGLNHPSAATNKNGGVLSNCKTVLKKVGAELEARFTNLEGAIAELKQEILGDVTI